MTSRPPSHQGCAGSVERRAQGSIFYSPRSAAILSILARWTTHGFGDLPHPRWIGDSREYPAHFSPALKPDSSSRSSALFRRRPVGQRKLPEERAQCASSSPGFKSNPIARENAFLWTSENPGPLDRIFSGRVSSTKNPLATDAASPLAMTDAVRQTVDSLGHEHVAKTHLVMETNRSFDFARTARCDSFRFLRRAGSIAVSCYTESQRRTSHPRRCLSRACCGGQPRWLDSSAAMRMRAIFHFSGRNVRVNPRLGSTRRQDRIRSWWSRFLLCSSPNSFRAPLHLG
jgi:hypothetical protein